MNNRLLHSTYKISIFLFIDLRHTCDHMKLHNVNDNTPPIVSQASQLSLDPSKIDNSLLKRLIGEIEFEKDNRVNAYNRTHNRHNRGR